VAKSLFQLGAVVAATIVCTTNGLMAADSDSRISAQSLPQISPPISPPTMYRFGSPAFIQEWNKRFASRQNMMPSGCTTVLPKYGFATQQTALPSAGATTSCGDYYAEELTHGATRWAHMPLSVYVQQGGMGYHPDYGQILSEAMQEWTRVSQGKIRFVNAPDSYSADITVDWLPGGPAGGKAGNTCSSFGNYGGHRVLARAHIDLAATAAGYQVSPAEMRKTCLHELGHALGLVHASQTCDIMYFQSNPAQACALSSRDAGTIRRLYGG
jgi:predicted Zn-dependent protease